MLEANIVLILNDCGKSRRGFKQLENRCFINLNKSCSMLCVWIAALVALHLINLLMLLASIILFAEKIQ